MPRPKKIGYRKLKKLYTDLQSAYTARNDVLTVLREENVKLRHQGSECLDTQMLDARVRLANALGQMMQTVTEATKFVIGKEVL